MTDTTNAQPLKLEVGKSYRTRDGRKAVVLEKAAAPACHYADYHGEVDSASKSWREDGRYWGLCEVEHDLIAEWDAPDADRWIQWHGGECPVPPETVVEARNSLGDVYRGPASVITRQEWLRHVSAYRIVQPAPTEPTIRLSNVASAKLLGISPELYCPEYTELCQARDATRLAYDLLCRRIEAFEDRAERKNGEAA